MKGPVGMTAWQGIPIMVETPAGQKRHWYDPHNKTEGSTTMEYSYGYVEGTESTDGDEVDVYLGPDRNAPSVFVVTQMKAPTFKEVDEQKCMLGFNSAEEAKAAYLRHYNNPKFFGSMKEISFEDWKNQLKSRKGSLIKALNAMTASATLSDTTFMRSSMSKHDEALDLLKSTTAELSKAGMYCAMPGEPKKDDEDEDKKAEVEKGLKAAAVLGLARAARLHEYGAQQMHEGSGIGTIRVRAPHEPPVVPVRRVDTPVQTLAPAGVTPESFAACGGCGLIHKSAQPCPRCEHTHSITPSLPAWRR